MPMSLSQRINFNCSMLRPGPQDVLKPLQVVHYIAEGESYSAQLIPKLGLESNNSFICLPKWLMSLSV